LAADALAKLGGRGVGQLGGITVDHDLHRPSLKIYAPVIVP